MSSSNSPEQQLLHLLSSQPAAGDSFSTDQVLDLLPRADLSYVDPKSSLNCLHLLARWKPGKAQRTVATEICRRLLLEQQRQSVKTGCLYRKTQSGNDPLNFAARIRGRDGERARDFFDFIDILLDADSKLMGRYASGKKLDHNRSRLMETAVIGGCKALIEYLARRFGWDASALSGIRTPGGCSLPQVAAVCDHVSLLEWFNEQAIPLNLEDNDGETALFDAAGYGRSEAASYLLDHADCDINHRGRLGDTALFRALKNDKFHVAELLLARGASATMRDFGGNCAIHAALQMPEDLVKQRKERKRQKQLQKEQGLSAAAEAVEAMQTEKKASYDTMLRLLESSHKVSMSTENLAGYNPLHSCVETRNWTGLRAALELLPSKVSGQDGETALANSSGVNLLHVFFCFHSDQADVDTLMSILGKRRWSRLLRERTVKGKGHGSRDRVGYNCLHFACDFNNKGVINYLLGKAGFQLSDRTATGKSAADLLLKHRSFKDVRRYYQRFNGQDDTDDAELGDDGAMGSGPRTPKKKKKKLGDAEHLHLCSLIDPVRAASSDQAASFHAIASPQRLTRKLLCRCSDEKERSELLRFPTASLSSFNSGRRGLMASGGRASEARSREVPLGVKLLARCLHEDDADGVRSLAVLGLLDGLWNSREFGTDVGRFLHPDRKHTRPVDLVEFCLRHGHYKTCLELLRFRQFDLVPTCLRFIIDCNGRIEASRDAGTRESLRRHRDQAKNVLLNALNCLDDRVAKEDARLVEGYLEGRMAGGPRYREPIAASDSDDDDDAMKTAAEFSITQLLERSGVEEAFATSCIRRLVFSAWTGGGRPGAACCCGGPDETVVTRPDTAPDSNACCSPEAKFVLHILTYLIFTVCFTVFITMGEACYSLKTHGGRALYTILSLFAIDFTVMQGCELRMGSGARRPDAWLIVRWLCGFLGPLLLLAGLIGMPIVEFVPELSASQSVQFGVHMYLAAAYLLMSARWLRFFKWLRFSGPTVGTIEKLLVQDLLPFLLIFLVFIVAFGVFFQVLLHPWRQAFAFMGRAARDVTVGDVIIGIYSRPLMLTFGEIEIDSLRKCQESLNCSEHKDSDCACPYIDGTRLYLALFGFVFLILNLALLNLLIAKFNLTVNTSVEQEFVTWSSYRFRLMQQFQQLPSAPPPFSWIACMFRGCRRRRNANKTGDVSANRLAQWWHNRQLEELPPGYRDFLWFQAQKLRGKRAEFLQPVQFPTDEDVDDAEQQLRECRLCHRRADDGASKGATPEKVAT